MASYVLEEGEVILLRDEKVTDANGKDVTLLLTNKHLIKIAYDFWGNGKDNYFALSRLRENNGAPNVLVGKDSNNKNRLELYFENSQQMFSFKGLLAEKKWASAIEKAYKARMKEIAKSEKEPINPAKIFAPVLGKIEAAKETLSQREQRIMSSKCPFCGAIANGKKGDEIKGVYCEHTFVIK